MTADQVKLLLQRYIAHLTARKVGALQDGGFLAHAHWMCREAQRLDAEKAARWVSFVQGVLWCEGEFTMDQLQEHTREVPGS